MNAIVGTIELTQDEQALAKDIAFDHDGIIALDHEGKKLNGARAASLIGSLLARKAIPTVRLQYFANPEYSPGHSMASYRDLLLRNNHPDDVMYRHPHFLKYLHYFIFGADLPPAVKAAFLAQVKDSYSDRAQLIQLARAQYREIMRNPPDRDYTVPEAFYQLALDCGSGCADAQAIRRAVKAVK